MVCILWADLFGTCNPQRCTSEFTSCKSERGSALLQRSRSRDKMLLTSEKGEYLQETSGLMELPSSLEFGRDGKGKESKENKESKGHGNQMYITSDDSKGHHVMAKDG